MQWLSKIGPAQIRLLAETAGKLEGRAAPTQSNQVTSFLESLDPKAVASAMRYLGLIDAQSYSPDLVHAAHEGLGPIQARLDAQLIPEFRINNLGAAPHIRGTFLERLASVNTLFINPREVIEESGRDAFQTASDEWRARYNDVQQGHAPPEAAFDAFAAFFFAVRDHFQLDDPAVNPWAGEPTTFGETPEELWKGHCDNQRATYAWHLRRARQIGAALDPTRVDELVAEVRPEALTEGALHGGRFELKPRRPRLPAGFRGAATTAADVLGRIAARDPSVYFLASCVSRAARGEIVETRTMNVALEALTTIAVTAQEAEVLGACLAKTLRAWPLDKTETDTLDAGLAAVASMRGHALVPETSITVTLGLAADHAVRFRRIDVEQETSDHKTVRLSAKELDLRVQWKKNGASWVAVSAEAHHGDGRREALALTTQNQNAVMRATLSLAEVRRVCWSKDGSLHKVELAEGPYAYVRTPVAKRSMAGDASCEVATHLLHATLGSSHCAVSTLRQTEYGEARGIIGEVPDYRTLGELARAGDARANIDGPNRAAYDLIGFVDLIVQAADLHEHNLGLSGDMPVAIDREFGFGNTLTWNLGYFYGKRDEVPVTEETMRVASAWTRDTFREVLAPSKLAIEKVDIAFDRLQILLGLANATGGTIKKDDVSALRSR